METSESKDPRVHTANVRKEFQTLIDHLRGDIDKIGEPKAQALFETTAEVITGLDRRSNITKRRARRRGNSEDGAPGGRFPTLRNLLKNAALTE